MNAEQLYRQIWERKLEGIQPPDQQHIDRVKWTSEMIDWSTPGTLLDIGCGSGAMLAAAHANGWGSFGIDIDADLVKWLRREGCQAFKCNIDQEPISTYLFDAVDVVTACDVIEHLLDPAKMLAEAFRLLRPGGMVYVGTPNASHWRRVRSLACGRMFRTSGDDAGVDGGHLSYWSDSNLFDALRLAGFSDLKVHYFSLDDAPAGVIAALRSLRESNDADRDRWDHTYLIAEGRKP